VIDFKLQAKKRNYYVSIISSPHTKLSEELSNDYYIVLIKKDFFEKVYAMYDEAEEGIPHYENTYVEICSDILKYLNMFAFESSKSMPNSEVTIGAHTTLIGHWIIRSILGESVDKYVEVQKETENVESGSSTLWRILLYICAAPFAIAIVAVAASLFIAEAADIFSLEIAMICVGASFVLAGFALIPVLFWSLTVPQLLLIGGTILILLPLGIIFCMVFYKAGAAMMGGFLRLMRKIFVKEER
jgi:uncharacterized membrane protein